MPYKISWYLQPHVLLIQYYDKVTLEEVQNAYEEIRRMVAESNGKVYTLMDMTRMAQLPMDIRGLRNLFSTQLLPMQGSALMYGHHNVFDIILSAITRLTNIPIYRVPNLEAALAWLRKHDPELRQRL